MLFTRNEGLCVGALPGGDPLAAERIARALHEAGVRSAAVTDIERLEWSKFAAWVGLMVLSVTTRVASADFLTEPVSASLVARLVREIGCLAAARSIVLSDHSTLPVATICAGTESDAIAIVRSFGVALRHSAPLHRMSSLQDLEAGRRLEIEETLGYAVRMARASKLDLPLLEAGYGLVTAIDRTSCTSTRALG